MPITDAAFTSSANSWTKFILSAAQMKSGCGSTDEEGFTPDPSGAGTRYYNFNSANFFLTFAASL
jgi:hypothetical protein